MLFVIVISSKAHKVKVQEIKRKTFSLNRRWSTLHTLTECHYKRKGKKKKKKRQQNNKRNYKISPKCYFLALGGGGVFFLARLGGKNILDLGINLFGLGLCLLCFSLNIILGLWRGLSLLALTFVFGPISPLVLIANLVGSFRSLKEGESNLGSQGLLWRLRSSGRGRWEGNRDFTDLRVVVYISRLPPLQVCRDSCKVKGFCLCYHAVIPAYLS